MLHAVSQLRLVVDPVVADILAWFETPRDMPGEVDALLQRHPMDPDVLAGALATLMERELLTDKDPAAEAAHVAAPTERPARSRSRQALDRLRRDKGEGAEAYWAVTQALGADDLGRTMKHRWDVLLFGDCELQMEADFLRRAAAAQRRPARRHRLSRRSETGR